MATDLIARDTAELARAGFRPAALANSLAPLGLGQYTPNSRFILLDGHSFADYDDGAVGGVIGTRRSNRGIGGWVQALCNGAVMVPLSRNAGFGGRTSADILAALPAVIAANKDCALPLYPGSNQINDRGGANFTLAQTIANTVAMFDMWKATGKPIVYVLSTPRIGMTNTDSTSTAQTANFMAFLAWERTTLQALYPNNIYIDVFDQFAVPGTTDPVAGATMDGTHPGPAMALAIATKIAAVFRRMFPVRDPIAALLAGRANLVTNPNFVGTTGTSSGSGTISGSVPTGFTQSKPGNHAVTVARKLSGDRYVYEVSDVYSGVAISSGAELVIPIGAIADGDYVQFAVEVQCYGVTGSVVSLFSGLRIGTSGTTYISGEMYKTTDSDFIPADTPFNAIYMTEPVLVAGLGASTPNFMVRADFGAAPGTATYAIARPTLVKIA